MLAFVACGWFAGWVLFIGLRRCVPSPDERNVSQTVSVIIPARDEEKNLPRLLRSISSAQEIIVVDDCSRDQTREIAQTFRARVIDGTPPPAGWRGKTWACQQGADAATGDLLLFLDADTWLEGDAVSTIASKSRDGALSVAPYHCVPTLREQFSAFFNLVMLAGAGPNQLLGQSLLLERSTYAAVGGHRAVRDQLLENFALGEKLRGRARSLLGRDVLHMRMYPRGWRELIDGWSKGFADGAAQTSPLRLALTVLWLTGCVAALGNLATYASFAVQLAVLLRRIGSYRLLTALLYPLPLLFFFAVFTRSVFRTRTREGILWKGRPARAA